MYSQEQISEVLRQGERLLLALEGVHSTSAILDTHCEINEEDYFKVAAYMASAAKTIQPDIVGIVMHFANHDVKGNLFRPLDLDWFDDNHDAKVYIEEAIADHGGFVGIDREEEEGIFLAPIRFRFPDSWQQVEKDLREMDKATKEGIQVMKDLRRYAMES